MKIGLIDADALDRGKVTFPNLALMKLSAWHKSKGDSVEWYEPLISGHLDRVYISKVFSWTPDFTYPIDADEVIRGGSGYCIELRGGHEYYNKEKDKQLPDEIEHIYPDYDIYGIADTAYGFLTRGCPRGCSFCHVKDKEGLKSYKCGELSQFWRGQKYISLLDPNILACKDCGGLFEQLIASGAYIDFNQGLDIRLMTEERAEQIKRMKIKTVHFAWDRYEDGEIIKPRLEKFINITGYNKAKCTVYVLTNFDTTLEQDLERVYFLRNLGISPYLTIYNINSIPKDHTLRRLRRWVNNRFIFAAVPTFEEYDTKK